jgi:hypothetical protein
MKKLFLALAIAMTLFSCEKPKGCGVCVGTGYIDSSGSSITYYLPIKWDNGTTTTISVDYDTWVNTMPGERICF